jgi:putative phosphoserine phosphatase / 1-acylglycerol-3-phosphate O-acyltransferase
MTADLDATVDRILGGPSGPGIGAFFDFDGTLIDGYSIAAYFGHRLKTREIGLGEVVELLPYLLRGELSQQEFGDLMRKGVREWAGRTDEELGALWQRLFRDEIFDTQFPEAWRLVQAHKRQGHTVAIASSATRYQIMPIAEEWGIEHVLCTQLVVRQGRLTGAIAGEPAWGEAKAEAVVRFARARRLDLKRSAGYANGNEDIPFLRRVGHPAAVNPKGKLAEVARQKSWPVLAFEARRAAPLTAVLRTLGSYAAMAATFAAGLGFAKATGETRRAVDLIASVGTELGLAVAGIEVEVVGEQHLWAHRPAVFIFNHQSKLDLLLMMYLLRRDFTGVAKKEAADVPGFGAFMRMANVAFIDRGNSQQARKRLQSLVGKIQKGLSLCIAPEGTRSYTPQLGPFKKGAFHLAMQAGVPIVPIVVRNSAEMMARNGQTFRAGKVQVAVLAPISVKRWTVAGLDRHVARVRQRFLDTLADWPREART